MNERLQKDLATLEERGVALQRYPQPDGWVFIVLASWRLPTGYNRNQSALLVKVPPPYPLAALDMFWLEPDVRLANGTQPANTSMEPLLNGTWLRFSWHPTAWRPSRDSLLTYLDFIACRLGQVG